jgi:hypothetical protein
VAMRVAAGRGEAKRVAARRGEAKRGEWSDTTKTTCQALDIGRLMNFYPQAVQRFVSDRIPQQ